MATVPFGEYRPDVSDYNGEFTRNILNVLPRGDGYGPFPDFSVYTTALPAACRGYFYARNTDASITVFAATSNRIYKLNNTDFTWADVSKGGAAYSDVTASDQWQFIQFGNFVIAVEANTAPQVFDLTSSSAFADLGGAPPQARYVSVVGRFVVLSGLLNNPYRIQWSGLNAATTWTSGLGSSDFQDLPDGGIVRGVAGGESGVICQDQCLRRMTYVPGSPLIFQIERITKDKGIFAPYSMTTVDENVFFILTDGFYMLPPGGYPIHIGKEKVDRSFFADVDSGSLRLVIGTSDPKSSRVFWAYKSVAGQSGLFDKILVYDYALQKFAPVNMSGEYIATLARPGITLEALDTIAPGAVAITGAANNGAGLIRLTVATTATFTTNQIVSVSGVVGTTEANAEGWRLTVVDSTHLDLQGSAFTNAYVSGGVISGSLDAMTFSLDDISTAALSQISAFNSAHRLGFFSGTNLEATLETAEFGDARTRVRVQGFAPLTDAATALGSVSTRANIQSGAVYTAEAQVNGQGICPANVSTRFAKGKLRVPAATAWTYAMGIDPKFRPEGMQ